MSDYCKIKGMECEFVLGEKKCLIDRTCKYMNEWLIEHDKQIRAEVINKHFAKIMSFINTSNRGNNDYFIVDQIENYIAEQLKEQE